MTQTATKGSRQAVGGAGDAQNSSAPVAGSMFGVPKYSTQPRLVPDNGNSNLGATLEAGSSVNLPTTKLDQLDIVTGMKLVCSTANTWDEGSGKTLTASPFWPANQIGLIQFKLQAAYNTFNLPGFLAAAFQAFRPMWGDRGLGASTPDVFANMGQNDPNVTGTASPEAFVIDVPFSQKFDEYYDLDAAGDPQNKFYDAIVSPMFMAAQARVVVPTITFNPQMATNDLLGSPVAKASGDNTSTYAGSASASLYRDAFWTSQSPAGNPPQFPWLYTRDYFRQPTAGQNEVGVLIQNTGVSVGQVLSLCGIVWDPSADGGLGAPVPFSSIDEFEIVTGGSLQNWSTVPQLVEDKMRSLYGEATATMLVDAGFFVFDYALSNDGSYLSNARAINTYLVNGVQLNIKFKSGDVPGSQAAVYLGVEALKLATS